MAVQNTSMAARETAKSDLGALAGVGCRMGRSLPGEESEEKRIVCMPTQPFGLVACTRSGNAVDGRTWTTASVAG